MQSARSLISKLKKDYPDFKFCKSNISHWSYTEKTIFYEDNIKHSDWILLHEISHAILNHKNYTRDIELLSKERDAWNFANTNLALKYGIQIDKDFIEDHIDTYRNWLHYKSSCPNCGLNGFEKNKGQYICPACGRKWKVNEARNCNIKRTQLNKHP